MVLIKIQQESVCDYSEIHEFCKTLSFIIIPDNYTVYIARNRLTQGKKFSNEKNVYTNCQSVLHYTQLSTHNVQQLLTLTKIIFYP